MSLFTYKQAIENVLPTATNRKPRKRSGNDAKPKSTRRVCRVEELEKREFLAVDPISVGVVYAEQGSGPDELGDKFYVAWVGGEAGSTTLDELVVNLDKNGNGSLDEGEAFFDTENGGAGVATSAPFTVVDKTSDIEYTYQVEDGGTTLKISFSNFHAGDTFAFSIDVDEYQISDDKSNENAIVEGAEFGGSVVNGIAGSTVSVVFSSEHYQTATWDGMFVDNYDGEYERSTALSNAYDAAKLPFDLDDASTEGTYNAGVYDDINLTPKPIIVSGYVYGDRDVDCNYDLGQDDPLANVEITLKATDGRTWTTTTDVDGYYEFNAADLLPGEYAIVSQTDLVSDEGAAYFDFCAKGGEFGTKVDPLHIKIDGMQGGDSAPNNNFAKALVGSISGNVFEDLNDADGKEDGENWNGAAYPAKIELWRVDVDANGVETKTLMETQTVGPNGEYRFKLDGSYGVDGSLRKLVEKNYEIREIFESEDYSDGTDYVGTLGGVALNDVFEDVYVGYGQHGEKYDFGELKLGSIAGNVYEDRNDNGVQDDGEIGIAGVTVELYQWNGADYVKIDDTKTDQNGSYLFDNLDINGEYAVKEAQPDAYDDGKDALGSLGGVAENDAFSKIEVGWDEHGVEYNFGELKLGSIAGNVFEDRNDNGAFEANEAGISGVTVELYQWDGADYVKVGETKTDENGAYLFDKLDISKEYAVKEAQPAAYSDGKDSIGSLGGTSVESDYITGIKVDWDDRGVEYNFGELKLGSISGNVYEDRNDDGVFDKTAGELGIAAVTVQLFRLESGNYVQIAETKTDANGFYKFENVDIEQTYAIKEIQPSAYSDGKDSVGTLGGALVENDYVDSIDVGWDESGENYNFGELKLGSLSGYVYNDVNDNGLKEDGEAPIANVVVELYQLKEGEYVKINETTTDENGFYKFENLDIEQKYAIKEIQPTAWDDGKDSVGTLGGAVVENDRIDDVNVFWDQRGENYNFGELTPPGSLSGYVYEDNNDNGLREDGEKGIANVVVELYAVGADGTATLVATQKTDANGYYLFDKLEANKTYLVRETQPSDYYDGKETLGTIFGEKVGELVKNDEISEIALLPRGEGIEYNFGELKPASLSGYVYEDLNDNGVKDSGEKGIPDATLTLWILENGEYVKTNKTATTDSTGKYVFSNLEPGRVYRIVETQPAGYNDGKDAAGSLGATVANDDLYAISVKPGDVGTDYNFGELIPSKNPPQNDIPDGGTTSLSVSVPNNLWGASPTNFPYIYYQPSNPGSTTNLYGGGGMPAAYSWRLSVLNGGEPRSIDALTSTFGFRGDFNFGDSSMKYVNVSWTPSDGFDYGEWIIRRPKGDGFDAYRFGAEGAKPIVGDWNGDGVAKIGLYVDGRWFLDRNGDGVWDEEDLWAELGTKDDQPVAGDWDGDGKQDIGVFGPQWASDPAAIAVEPGLPSDLNRYVTVSRAKNVPPSEEIFNRGEINVRAAKHRDSGEVRLDLIDHVFSYGNEGDVALTGDWTGDGVTKIGVYRNGDWYFDMNGNGRWDDDDFFLEHVGGAGYQPVVGDFNGDGVDSIGLFAEGTWLIDVDGDRRFDSTVQFGQTGDRAVVGDFNGDGIDELAVYRPGQQHVDQETPRQASAPNDSEPLATAQTSDVATLQR